jgi:hypothetical protein
VSKIGSIRCNKTKKNLSSDVSNYPNYQKLATQGSVFVVFKNRKLRHYVFHLSLNTEGENAEGYIFSYYTNDCLLKSREDCEG